MTNATTQPIRLHPSRMLITAIVAVFDLFRVAAIAQGLSPGWFFVGIEKLKLVSAVQLATRAAAAALTFVLVDGPGDAWVVLALTAGAAIASYLFGTLLLHRLVGVVLPVWTAIGAADGAVAGAVDVPAGRIAAVTVLGLLVVLALVVGLVLTRRAALAWPLALAALALALVVAVYPLLATAARAVQQGREFIPWVSDLVARFTRHDRAAEIAKEAYQSGRTVREVARAKGVLPDDELDKVLDPEGMTRPGA